MDSLTSRLQQKVEQMLVKQQQEFIQSYKQHMTRVKQQFGDVDRRIQEYEKKILYYENEGEMSHLVIKCNKLQEECTKLYKDLQMKEKMARDNQLTMKVQRSEIKRYQKERRVMLREKNELVARLEEMGKQFDGGRANVISKEEVNVKTIQPVDSTHDLIFATELQHVSRNEKNDLLTEYQLDNSHNRSRQHMQGQSSPKSLTLDLSLQHSHIATTLPHHLPHQEHASHLLRRQISSLKKKNQQLTSYQSHMLQSAQSMQSFFISCVNEIKQQIKIRKKINDCTFEQWKKEDKIQLLIKVLSNQDVLVDLYQRLFRRRNVVGRMVGKDGGKHGGKEEGDVNGGRDGMNVERQAEMSKRFGDVQGREKGMSLVQERTVGLKERKQYALSHAKRRMSKHISENSLLPKIHFHLEY